MIYITVLSRSVFKIVLMTGIFLAGCSMVGGSPNRQPVADALTPSGTNTPWPAATATPIVSPWATVSPLATETPPVTATPTIAATPTATAVPSTPTDSPTPSDTPTITPTATITPTPQPPKGVLNVAQANCRYGPGAAYLYKFGLYQGISVEIEGRTDRGDWVYVLPKWYETGCWIKASLLAITGDVFSVGPYYGILPFSEYYPPPVITGLTRKGDEVWIAWEDVGMTEDKYRGYLIEAWLCKDGEVVFTPVHVDGTFVILKDEAGCSEPSKARIFTAEKHGYSKWRIIAWPPAVESGALHASASVSSLQTPR